MARRRMDMVQLGVGRPRTANPGDMLDLQREDRNAMGRRAGSTAPDPGQAPEGKPGLHARNRHRQGYDFAALAGSCPGLAVFLTKNPVGGTTIDFADPAAVKTLNRALLTHHYGVQDWDIPPGYLCPPIPGRADYLHHLADLLAESRGGSIQQGSAVRVLDIGVGVADQPANRGGRHAPPVAQLLDFLRDVLRSLRGVTMWLCLFAPLA